MVPARQAALAECEVADEEARMNTVERRVRAMINPWSTAFARWWCHSAARFTLTGHGPRRRELRRGRDVVWPAPADTAAVACRRRCGSSRSRRRTSPPP
jgi:hypothetical protein